MDDLRATFASRWRELGMEATVMAPDETLRPEAPSGDARSVESAAAPSLPRITLDLRDGDGDTRAAATGDLVVLGTLGEGGMGRVLLARQRSLRREVAVKTVKPGSPRRALGALLAEGALTGSLEHPGIVPVHLLGVDDHGHPALVMKRIEGVAWSALVDDPAHPVWAEVAGAEDRLVTHLRILVQVANALHFAHSRGVVHRDVKPENVMVGRFGEVYLVDWGVAGALGVADGELCGTPGFMAPEQVSAQVVTAATDVYLLGATLHNVLTGQLLHDARTLHACLEQAFVSEPVPHGPEVPEELSLLIHRATAREAADRPPSALEFRRAVEEFLRHRASRALAATAEERLVAVHESATDPGRLGESLLAAAEARFGFEQALREWPDNPVARAGLERARHAQIELELGQGNVQSARALLALLETPAPELEARARALEEARRLAEERSRRLAELDHQRDATVGSRHRAVALGALATTAIGAAVWVTSSGGTSAVTPQRLVLVSLVVTSLAVAVLTLVRGQLLSTAYNRGAVGLLLALMAGILGHRVLGWLDHTPPSATLRRELLWLTVGAGIGAVLHSRPFVYPMLVYAAGAAVATLAPERAVEAFSVTTVVGIVVLLLAWRSPGAPPA